MKSAQLRESIMQENEQNRQDFHLMKAIENFDHFMDVSVHYHISNVNEAIADCYRSLYPFYEQISGRGFKNFVTKRLAQIHLYKQLPADESAKIKKEEVIGNILETLESDLIRINEQNSAMKIKNLVLLEE